MKSINFEMLRAKYPELADIGAFAEYYAYPDPASGLVKLRAFVEVIINYIYPGFSIRKIVVSGYAAWET